MLIYGCLTFCCWSWRDGRRLPEEEEEVVEVGGSREGGTNKAAGVKMKMEARDEGIRRIKA